MVFEMEFQSFLVGIYLQGHCKTRGADSKWDIYTLHVMGSYRWFINGAEAYGLPMYVPQLFHELLYVHIYTYTVHGRRIIEACRSNSYVKDFFCG